MQNAADESNGSVLLWDFGECVDLESRLFADEKGDSNIKVGWIGLC